MAGIKESQVIEIRLRASAGAKTADLAAEFGMSMPGMRHVITGRSWSHVPLIDNDITIKEI